MVLFLVIASYVAVYFFIFFRLMDALFLSNKLFKHN